MLQQLIALLNETDQEFLAPERPDKTFFQGNTS